MNLVILDRDGVINEDRADHVLGLESWQPLAGSLDAIARLSQAGHRVVLATNQSGVGRGLLTIEALNVIHEHMCQRVAACGGHIEAVFFCPHRPDAGCDCRKPLPGLLLQAAARLRTTLEGVPMVGDSLSDVQAARAAGASPVLVRTGKGRATEAELGDDPGVPVFDDLAAFVDDRLSADRRA